MIDCPICHVPNDDDARFCAECGQRLQQPTPQAGPPPAVPPGTFTGAFNQVNQADVAQQSSPNKLHSPLLGATGTPSASAAAPISSEKPELDRLRRMTKDEETTQVPEHDQAASAPPRKLRSPLLAQEEYDENEEQSSNYGGGQGQGGQGNYGGGQQSNKGSSFPHRTTGQVRNAPQSADEGHSEPQAKSGTGRSGKMRSPLLGGGTAGDDDDYAEYPKSPASRGGGGGGGGNTGSGRKFRSPMLSGGSNDDYGDSGDYEDDPYADDDNPNVLRSPLLAARRPLGGGTGAHNQPTPGGPLPTVPPRQNPSSQQPIPQQPASPPLPPQQPVAQQAAPQPIQQQAMPSHTMPQPPPPPQPNQPQGGPPQPGSPQGGPPQPGGPQQNPNAQPAQQQATAGGWSGPGQVPYQAGPQPGAPGQPAPGQPAPGQPAPGQPAPGQPAAQPFPPANPGQPAGAPPAPPSPGEPLQTDTGSSSAATPGKFTTTGTWYADAKGGTAPGDSSPSGSQQPVYPNVSPPAPGGGPLWNPPDTALPSSGISSPAPSASPPGAPSASAPSASTQVRDSAFPEEDYSRLRRQAGDPTSGNMPSVPPRGGASSPTSESAAPGGTGYDLSDLDTIRSGNKKPEATSKPMKRTGSRLLSNAAEEGGDYDEQPAANNRFNRDNAAPAPQGGQTASGGPVLTILGGICALAFLMKAVAVFQFTGTQFWQFMPFVLDQFSGLLLLLGLMIYCFMPRR